MCNFVPGEAVAFGPRSALDQVDTQDLPGIVQVFPLQPDDLEGPFQAHAVARLSGIPTGMEVFAATRWASRIRQEQVTVELNYQLPVSALRLSSSDFLRLSAPASDWARTTRDLVHRRLDDWSRNRNAPVPRRFGADRLRAAAILDVEIDVRHIDRSRRVSTVDYSVGVMPPPPITPLATTVGHGTRVAKVLDAALPSEVPFVLGQVGDLTSLGLARSFADLVARHDPAVVNVSLAPFDNEAICGHCGERAEVPAFYSMILSHVIAMAKRTFTVFAAGNSSARCCPLQRESSVNNMAFAVAIDRTGRRSTYSSTPSSLREAVCAFGGDASYENGGTGMFVTDQEKDKITYGTSFAAPLVSALAYPNVIVTEETDRESVLGPDCHTGMHGWTPDFVRRERLHW